MSFVHLHAHTEYSLLDGQGKIKKMVARAKELGMPGLAISDHGTMFGVIEFFRACRANEIKPIIGVEAYLAPRSMRDRDPQKDRKAHHLLLLAENETGYKNLLRIATAAQLEGFYYNPRVDHDFLAGHAEGLICTTGCLNAEIPKAIVEGRENDVRKQLDWYYQVFGQDNFFFELQDHDIPELRLLNKALHGLGPRYNARFVATNDVHYVRPEDHRLQDIMLCIQTGALVADKNRMRMSDTSYYLRSPDEMRRLFGEVPGAIENTLLIAERCSVDLSFRGYRLPVFPVPHGHTAESYLGELSEQGLRRRYGPRAGDPAVRERLAYELGVINKMGFATYFLIVWDLCRFARENGIWFNARGSAAGSLAAYCLAITLVEPLEHDLIFERFLNPDRVSMPDIDLDFQDDRRHEVLQYTSRKYGEDKVAQIITFGTLGARAAIRDVGRVLNVDLNQKVDPVAKLVPNIPGKPVTIAEALETVPELKERYQSDDEIREMVDTARALEGAVRNAGTHAAGVVITDRPVIDYVPLHRPTKSAAGAEESPISAVTQFEMEILDSLGLLKVDFLGLRTLTIMAHACEFIRQRHGVDYHLDNIPTDDPAIYQLLSRGDVAGVFQVEGAGMRRFLVEMKPTRIDHIIAMVALYRPGPIDFIPTYIRRMHGEEPITYRHPRLEPILASTYGISVFQEQIMRAVIELAGYTASESDSFRKVVAKKKGEEMIKQRQKFVEGAVKNGIAEETANLIFDDWETFARYGFNKAHAADYAVICAQTAFLKARYPAEYMAALLTADKGDTDKVSLYVADARRMGIEVKPPDVNFGGLDFTIDDGVGSPVGGVGSPAGGVGSPVGGVGSPVGGVGSPVGVAGPPVGSGGKPAIRFGLGAIKNVGGGAVAEILRARGEGGPFRSIDDFCQRVDLRLVGKRALECLIKVGALESLGRRAQLLAGLEAIVAVSTSAHKASEVGQFDLFGSMGGSPIASVSLPKNAPDLPLKEMRASEKELIGTYVSDHPLMARIDEIQSVITHYSGDLGEELNGKTVVLAGQVTHIRKHISAKSNKEMAFAAAEDLQGALDLVIFPSLWKEVKDWLQVDQIVIITGKVDAQGGKIKILADGLSREAKLVGPVSQGFGVRGQRAEKTPNLQPPASKMSEPAFDYAAAGMKYVDDAFDPFAGEAFSPEEDPGFGPDTESTGSAPTNGYAGGGGESVAAITETMVAVVEDRPAGVERETNASSRASSAPAEAAVPSDMIWEDRPVLTPPAPARGFAPARGQPAGRGNGKPEKWASYGEESEKPGDRPAEPADEQPRRVVVTLDSAGDKLLLRRVYDALISHPGKDQFSLRVTEVDGRQYELDFYNEATTHYCGELVQRLLRFVPREAIEVRVIHPGAD